MDTPTCDLTSLTSSELAAELPRLLAADMPIGVDEIIFQCPKHQINPRKDMTMNRILTATAAILLSVAPAFAQEPCKVNVNSATPAQIAFLIRTGPVLAARIVEARPLDAVKLDAVKGVGEAWMSNNGPHVTYAGPTTCTEKLKAPKPAAKQ